jgi:hypothetical protein
MTNGQAIAIWNLLGIDFLYFDYNMIYGRRLSPKEYNTRKVVEFICGQVYKLMGL